MMSMSMSMAISKSMTLSRRFLRRPAADRRLLLRALALYTCVASLLRIVQFGTLSDWLRRYGGHRPANGPLDSAAIDRIVWAVQQAASVAPWGRTCLTEALTAEALLRRAGCDTTLRYGVAAEGEERLAAHAWLEHNGVEIIGGPSRFHEPLHPSAVRIA
jgi:hypothetical protein